MSNKSLLKEVKNLTEGNHTTIFDFALNEYMGGLSDSIAKGEKQSWKNGRGLVLMNLKKVEYIRYSDSRLKASEVKLLTNYNPTTQVVIALPLLKLGHGFRDTAIYSKNDELAQTKIVKKQLNLAKRPMANGFNPKRSFDK